MKSAVGLYDWLGYVNRGSVEGDLAGEQWVWFREAAAKCNGPIAVFMHHPPVFVGSQWVDQLSPVSLGVFANLVEEFEQLKLVVCGHVHQEYYTQIFHADVFTTPSTCVQFKPNAAEFGGGFIVSRLPNNRPKLGRNVSNPGPPPLNSAIHFTSQIRLPIGDTHWIMSLQWLKRLYF